MKTEELYRHYLDKMQEAETAAVRTRQTHLRGRWLAIAEGYRILAEGYRKRLERWRSQANPRS
jgi:hypothetical protein